MAASKDPNRQDTGARSRPFSAWPSWYYHPSYAGPDSAGREPPHLARIFNSPDEVPEGWTATPGVPDTTNAPSASDLKLKEALAEIERLKAAVPVKPTKKLSAKAAAERAKKEAALVAVGYDAEEIAASTDEMLDELLKTEAEEAAKQNGPN